MTITTLDTRHYSCVVCIVYIAVRTLLRISVVSPHNASLYREVSNFLRNVRDLTVYAVVFLHVHCEAVVGTRLHAKARMVSTNHRLHVSEDSVLVVAERHAVGEGELPPAVVERILRVAANELLPGGGRARAGFNSNVADSFVATSVMAILGPYPAVVVATPRTSGAPGIDLLGGAQGSPNTFTLG